MVTKKSRNRIQEIIFMVLAISMLVVGFPITVYFIYDLERNLDGGNIWESIEEEDLQEVTLGYGGGGYTVPLLEFRFNGFFQDITQTQTEHKEMIIWNHNNDTLDRIVMAPTLALESYETLIHILAIFTNWTIDSMIEQDINMCRFQISSSKPINIGLIFHEVTDGTVDIAKNTTVLVSDNEGRTGNHTHFFNWTALDLLEIKAERGGSARLSIRISTDVDEGFVTGDQIGFDVGFNPVDDDSLTQFMILKIGAGVLAVIFGMAGLGSTGLWNPLSKDNPGIVDRWISWGSRKASNYLNRKKRRRT